ncbi:hypothetical protein QYE76_061433 [Lolium multiflorum]|uniref:Uncharacterized protein n=1 Tax=Lolium multiflorum TaxID=4521 RepID=A0AAD8S269_LOLMU|nr:hypothetical protein QYE76_061433 [Lolium multiflorum]
MAAAAAALASSPLVHLTAAARLRLPRPRASPSCSRWGCPRGAYLDWRPLRRCDRMRRFSVDEGGGGGEADGEKRSEEEPAAAAVEAKAGAAEEVASERSRSGSFSSSSSPSSVVRCTAAELPVHLLLR